MEHFCQKKVVDSRGSPCPGPMTELTKAYRSANLGDVLEVWATDPAASNDIQTWTNRTGNQLLEIANEKDYTRIVVQVTKKKA